MDFHNAFIETPLDVRDGQLYVPDKPGLGLDMNLEYLRALAARLRGASRRE